MSEDGPVIRGLQITIFGKLTHTAIEGDTVITFLNVREE